MRFALWALVGGTLLFAGAQSPGNAADPLEIYVISSQTGPISFGGKLQAPGALGLEAYVNKTGGIRGRPIKVVIIDEQSNPSVAVQDGDVQRGRAGDQDDDRGLLFVARGSSDTRFVHVRYEFWDG